MFLFAAEAAAEGGFYGQLVELFHNNVINWIVLMALVIWLWTTKTPAMFQARKERIDAALNDASQAKKQGEQFLAEQKQRVAKADDEAARILADAKQLAAQMVEQQKEQTQRDIADLEKKITSQIANERQLAITELRAAAARASIKLTEEALPLMMNDKTKSQLLTQFIEQLDSVTAEGPPVSAGHLESIH
jgi:F-type H+-transporting ATPase subunit b